MKSIFYILLIILPSFAQTPLVRNIITFSKSEASITLTFGIDSTATDNLDFHLNEYELPPLPPSNIFDARFVGTTIGIDLGNGTLNDYRFGNLPLLQEIAHEIYIQNQNNDDLNVAWNLNEGVTASLTDFFDGSIVNIEMEGTGNSIFNTGYLTNLKLNASYNILTKIEEIQKKPQFDIKAKVYPNPFNNHSNLLIYSERSEIIEIKYFDLLGRLIKKESTLLSEGGNNIRLDLNGQSSGIYFLLINSSRSLVICKLILTK